MSVTVRAIALACIFFAGGCSASVPRIPQRTVAEAPASVSTEAIERGRLLTSTVCTACHATGATGDSPLPDATPLREVVGRYSLDQLEVAFAEGFVTTHPAMPGYVFRASEIDDLIAYLETLKTDR